MRSALTWATRATPSSARRCSRASRYCAASSVESRVSRRVRARLRSASTPSIWSRTTLGAPAPAAASRERIQLSRSPESRPRSDSTRVVHWVTVSLHVFRRPRIESHSPASWSITGSGGLLASRVVVSSRRVRSSWAAVESRSRIAWTSRLGVIAVSWVSSRLRTSAARAATSASGIGPAPSAAGSGAGAWAWARDAVTRTRENTPPSADRSTRIADLRIRGTRGTSAAGTRARRGPAARTASPPG